MLNEKSIDGILKSQPWFRSNTEHNNMLINNKQKWFIAFYQLLRPRILYKASSAQLHSQESSWIHHNCPNKIKLHHNSTINHIITSPSKLLLSGSVCVNRWHIKLNFKSEKLKNISFASPFFSVLLLLLHILLTFILICLLLSRYQAYPDKTNPHNITLSLEPMLWSRALT